MRTTVKDALPDTGTIQKVTRAVDGMGGHTDTWSDQGTVVCRISPTSGSGEKFVADRKGAVQSWTITVDQSVDITVKDRFAIDGRTFELVGLMAARSWEVSRRLVAVEVV
jgi:head-tail adaptor